MANVLRAIVSRFGSLDVLVNNAGVGRAGVVEDLPTEAGTRWSARTCAARSSCAKHSVPAMRAQGAGKIVNVGSMFSLFGPPGFSPYAAAKTGILGLTRALAVELAPTIQVNALLPGWFETELTRGTRASPRGDEIRRPCTPVCSRLRIASCCRLPEGGVHVDVAQIVCGLLGGNAA